MKLVQVVFNARAVSIVLFLVMAACASRPIPTPPLENVELWDDTTYGVVAIRADDPVPSNYLLCLDDGSGRYTIEADRTTVECTKPDGGAFMNRVLVLTPRGYKVREGLNLDFLAIGTSAGFLRNSFEAKNYIISLRVSTKSELGVVRPGLVAQVTKATPIQGETFVHSIAPHSIQFLGFMQQDGSIAWRDPGSLVDDIIKRVEGATPERVVSRRPERIEVTCSGDSARQNCSIVSRGN